MSAALLEIELVLSKEAATKYLPNTTRTEIKVQSEQVFIELYMTVKAVCSAMSEARDD